MRYLSFVVALLLAGCSNSTTAQEPQEEQPSQDNSQAVPQELNSTDKLHKMMCDVLNTTKLGKINWERKDKGENEGIWYSWNGILLTWNSIQFSIQDDFVVKIDRKDCEYDLYNYLQEERQKQEDVWVNNFIQHVSIYLTKE